MFLMTHFDWSWHVGLLDAQDDLPGDRDTVEEVVDEAHVVDKCVHVTGAQHQKRRDTLRKKKKQRWREEETTTFSRVEWLTGVISRMLVVR